MSESIFENGYPLIGEHPTVELILQAGAPEALLNVLSSSTRPEMTRSTSKSSRVSLESEENHSHPALLAYMRALRCIVSAAANISGLTFSAFVPLPRTPESSSIARNVLVHIFQVSIVL